MIWHVVRFDFADVDDEVRAEVEAGLEGLAEIAQVAWLRVGRDTEQPTVTGLMVGLRSEEDLATYRTHPDHVPVVERIRDLGVAASRFDIETADDPAALP